MTNRHSEDAGLQKHLYAQLNECFYRLLEENYSILDNNDGKFHAFFKGEKISSEHFPKGMSLDRAWTFCGDHLFNASVENVRKEWIIS